MMRVCSKQYVYNVAAYDKCPREEPECLRGLLLCYIANERHHSPAMTSPRFDFIPHRQSIQTHILRRKAVNDYVPVKDIRHIATDMSDLREAHQA